MTKKPLISFTQLLAMGVGSALMFPYTILPIMHSANANQDVWLVEILSMVYLFLIGLPILILSNLFRGLTMNQICELILGKWAGKLFALFYVPVFFFCFSACMSLGRIFVDLDLLPHTPAWAYLIYGIIPIAYLVFKGAGAIGRISVLITAFMIITILLFFLLGIQMMDVHTIEPILADSTLANINTAAFINAGRVSELIFLLIFCYYLQPKVSITKIYSTSILVLLAASLLIVLPTILVLGLDVAKNAFNPYFNYTRQVHGGEFIQRVQSLNALAWFPGLIQKIAMNVFMGCFVLAGVFNTKSHKPFIIPFCAAGFVVCLLPFAQEQSLMLQIASDQIFPWVILPFSFILPTLLLIVYLIRKKTIDPIAKQIKARASVLQTGGN